MSKKIISIHLPKVDSTNTWAKENYKKFDFDHITRVTTSHQTNGRGRFNRVWLSGKDENICVTYFFTLPKKELPFNNLSQIFSLSIVHLLKECEIASKLKWPNDLLVNGKKISGVLCEMLDLNEQFGVVIGAGINVNMEKESLQTIDQESTSLLNETGKTFSIDPLLKKLDHLFLEHLTLYLKEGFNPFYEEFNALLAFKGKPITFKDGNLSYRATFDSLNPDGRLNLKLNSGEIKTILSGEIDGY